MSAPWLLLGRHGVRRWIFEADLRFTPIFPASRKMRHIPGLAAIPARDQSFGVARQNHVRAANPDLGISDGRLRIIDRKSRRNVGGMIFDLQKVQGPGIGPEAPTL